MKVVNVSTADRYKQCSDTTDQQMRTTQFLFVKIPGNEFIFGYSNIYVAQSIHIRMNSIYTPGYIKLCYFLEGTQYSKYKYSIALSNSLMYLILIPNIKTYTKWYLLLIENISKSLVTF